MDFERTVTLSEAAIAHLFADPTLHGDLVPSLRRKDEHTFQVEYRPMRVGDRITTYAGFSIAMRIADVDDLRGTEIDYDPRRGFIVRRQSSCE